MSSNNIYYVYAYLRSKDSVTAKAGTPYYIGKGKGKRAYSSSRTIPIPADKKNIVFLETHLSEIGALALERRMIKWYGRIDTETGILRNKTDGGDGSSGLVVTASARAKRSAWHKGKTLSDESRKLISAANKGRLTGIPKSDEHRRKISESNKGKELTQRHKNNIKKNHHNCNGENNSAAKQWMITSPLGEVWMIRGRFQEFCKEQGISACTLRKIADGLQPVYGKCVGWQCKLIPNIDGHIR